MSSLRSHLQRGIESCIKYISVHDVNIIPRSLTKVILSYESISLTKISNKDNAYNLIMDFGDIDFSYELQFKQKNNKLILMNII